LNSGRFQILSLDGGGIKGLFSAAVLAAIEEDCGTPITDHFDLITGTSTGGIIAIALGMGMSPREIVEFYLTYGPRIFPQWLGLKRAQHFAYRKYSPQNLITALRSCFGNKRFGESAKRLVIPSYSMGEDQVYLFRTPHHPKLRRDYKVFAWQVAAATSSAPTFFPCFKGVDGVRLIDGGVWANNPVMAGIVEAYRFLDVPLESIAVVSIGTTDETKARSQHLDNGGLIRWVVSKAATEIVLRSQSIAANNHAKLLLGEGNVERLNPTVPDGVFTLDGSQKADQLIGKAAFYSRLFTPVYTEKFSQHMAPQYVPLVTVDSPVPNN
jgi:patatin-like phospholipase/acyl hydrolase